MEDNVRHSRYLQISIVSRIFEEEFANDPANYQHISLSCVKDYGNRLQKHYSKSYAGQIIIFYVRIVLSKLSTSIQLPRLLMLISLSICITIPVTLFVLINSQSSGVTFWGEYRSQYRRYFFRGVFAKNVKVILFPRHCRIQIQKFILIAARCSKLCQSVLIDCTSGTGRTDGGWPTDGFQIRTRILYLHFFVSADGPQIQHLQEMADAYYPRIILKVYTISPF